MSEIKKGELSAYLSDEEKKELKRILEYWIELNEEPLAEGKGLPVTGMTDEEGRRYLLGEWNRGLDVIERVYYLFGIPYTEAEFYGHRRFVEEVGLKVKEVIKGKPYVKEVSFIEDTEAKGKQRFWFNSEADAEICAIVMGQVMTGEYRFTSPVNYEEKGLFRVRGVLRPAKEKWGTPQLMNAKDYENSWLLQQFFSWILEGTLRIISVDWKKEAWIVVEWEKVELPVLEREWKMYKVEEKRINGRSWRITGEKK